MSPACLPSAPGSQPSRWSKDRFSIVTRTMWSIPDCSGAGSVAASAIVDPTGQFLYVACYDANAVSAYVIDAAGGLTQIDSDPATPGVQDFPAGTRPQFVTVDPTGRFVYVSNANSNDLSAFSINAATGELSPIAG